MPNIVKSKKIVLTIVIPVFNEEKTLPMLINRLLKLIPVIKRKVQSGGEGESEASVEFLFVNDGSVDATERLLQSIVSRERSF